MVSKNTKKTKNAEQNGSSTQLAAGLSSNHQRKSTTTPISTSATTKAMKKLQKDSLQSSNTGDFYEVGEVSSSTSKVYKTASKKSSAMSQETSVTEIQSTNEALLEGMQQYSSSSAQFHQEMSDEFSTSGKIIASIDLVSESNTKEPVFSVPIEVVEYVTAGPSSGGKQMFSSTSSSSVRQSSSSQSQQMSTSSSTTSKAISSSTGLSSLDAPGGGGGGYIVDVEFQPETTVITKNESMASKQAYQSVAKTINGATEMTSSSMLSNQYKANESLNGTTINEQNHSNTEYSSYSTPNYGKLPDGSAPGNMLHANTPTTPLQPYQVTMPVTPTSSDTQISQSNNATSSKIQQNVTSKSSINEFSSQILQSDNKTSSSTTSNREKIHKIDNQNLLNSKTSNTELINQDTSNTTNNNNITSSTSTTTATSKQQQQSLNKKSTSSSSTSKQITEQESLTQESHTKKSNKVNKKEFFDVKTKTWTEYSDDIGPSGVNMKQPTYERLVSQGLDGTCKVTYKKKIYDQRNNRWRVIEEKIVDNAHDTGFPEIADDVINTTRTTYTTKVYDSKLGQWKVVDEKSYVDAKAYVPQDIVREIEKDNTDVANITTTTEITKVSERQTQRENVRIREKRHFV